MATHTTLPIYKAAYDLLGLSSDMVKNMDRDYKRTIGEKIANTLRHRGHSIKSDLSKTYRRAA